MKTAIDSSVLLSIFNDEADAQEWLTLLIAARRQGQLVICDVVYAELAPLFQSETVFRETLGKMGISYEPLSSSAAWRAGVTFRVYQQAGGPREHLIPDFLIAAHAEIQANRLAAKDRGYLRHYYSGLPLLTT